MTRRAGVRVRLKRGAVEAALARHNLTKTALARAAGLHRTHLSDLLAGRATPGPRTRARLLGILGGTFDEFFEIIPGPDARR
ncbi:MAG TPA: helix-turn-helix transcriptional regulator [bacterium]|nr:helix-turn-helix transcriptional regulator [bacterium]